MAKRFTFENAEETFTYNGESYLANFEFEYEVAGQKIKSNSTNPPEDFEIIIEPATINSIHKGKELIEEGKEPQYKYIEYAFIKQFASKKCQTKYEDKIRDLLAEKVG